MGSKDKSNNCGGGVEGEADCRYLHRTSDQPGAVLSMGDQVLANVHQVFTRDDRREKALARENSRLKSIIGDLTVELKKQTSG